MDITSYTKAAETGNSDAQFQLGLLHAEQRDYGIAYKWLELSNQGGNAIKILANSMAASDIFRAQRLAREWRAKHNSRPPVGSGELT